MKLRSGAAARWIFLLTGVSAIWASYWYFAKQTSKLSIAAENLQSCRQLAEAVCHASQSPHRAQLTTRSVEDLGGIVEKAAANGQLGRERILRIDPQPAKRVGKTDYLEQATEVELLTVTLRQLVEFLFNLAGSDSLLDVGTLRLRMPHAAVDSTAQELWLADVVLTQRIYAPTTPHQD